MGPAIFWLPIVNDYDGVQLYGLCSCGSLNFKQVGHSKWTRGLVWSVRRHLAMIRCGGPMFPGSCRRVTLYL